MKVLRHYGWPRSFLVENSTTSVLKNGGRGGAGRVARKRESRSYTASETVTLPIDKKKTVRLEVRMKRRQVTLFVTGEKVALKSMYCVFAGLAAPIFVSTWIRPLFFEDEDAIGFARWRPNTNRFGKGVARTPLTSCNPGLRLLRHVKVVLASPVAGSQGMVGNQECQPNGQPEDARAILDLIFLSSLGPIAGSGRASQFLGLLRLYPGGFQGTPNWQLGQTSIPRRVAPQQARFRFTGRPKTRGSGS